MAEKIGANVTINQKVYVKTVEQQDVDHAKAKWSEHLLARARGKAKNGRGKHFRDIPVALEYEIDEAEAEKFHIPRLGAKLYVAEAFIKPNDGTNSAGSQAFAFSNPTEQLRIAMTGPTTCGKSTFLGTLTTGELDNGRGKSRLSLFRHMHELVSGVTSSISWEIIGYKPQGLDTNDEDDGDCGFFGGDNETKEEDPISRVVNYATGNISSWTDIHSSAEGGRIIFMSDSAGHLKYRRTTVRSLVGWAPHYAALLIPANDCDTESKDATLGLSEATRVHMELCLKLHIPLIVLFTKIDIASKTGLRAVLSSVLSTLKANGRRPLMVRSSAKIQETVDAVAAEPDVAVPIIFTSSVKGDGVNLVHELLMKLPMPKIPVVPTVDVASHVAVVQGTDEQGLDTELTTLFHVEEVYGLRPDVNCDDKNSGGSVISGHVRYGKLSIGDKLVLGPFHANLNQRSRCGTPFGTPSLSTSAGRFASQHRLSASPESGDERRSMSPSGIRRGNNDESEEVEWRLVRVVSVRRLRLPVASLFAGEAGTIGIVPIEEEDELPMPVSPVDGILITTPEPSASLPINIACASSVTFAPPPDAHEPEGLRLRKGLVILNRSIKPGKAVWMKAYTGFTAVLDDKTAAQNLAVGREVIAYIASVRTVARIMSVDPPFDQESGTGVGGEKFVFEFSGLEWIESDAKVLIMLNAGTGMDVFVGKVVARAREVFF